MHVIYSLYLTFDGLLRLVAWSNLGPIFYPVIHNYVFFHLLCNLSVRKFILQYKKRLKYEYFFLICTNLSYMYVLWKWIVPHQRIWLTTYIYTPPKKNPPKNNQICRSCSCVMHCMCMSLVYKSNFLKDVRKLNEHINIS